MRINGPVLAVIQPEAPTQPALARGINLARCLGLPLELFASCFQQLPGDPFFDASQLAHLREEAVEKQLTLLSDIARQHASEGIAISVHAAWDKPEAEAIVRQTLRSRPSLVLKDTSFHETLSRATFTGTDWELIRTCPAPLWLVRSDAPLAHPVFLAAVDPLHEYDKPATLDRDIIGLAQRLAEPVHGQVQLFHSFSALPSLGQAGKFAYKQIPADEIEARVRDAHQTAFEQLGDEFGIPADARHLHRGNATELLPWAARESDAEVVIMGAVARSRRPHTTIGSTAASVLDHLPCDLLIVKPDDFNSSVSFDSQPKGAIHARRDELFSIAV